MYIIYEAYDDNSAIVLDIGNFSKKLMTEEELISIGSKQSVIGLSVTDNKINYIDAYDCISFATEDEATEYIKDNDISLKNKIYASGLWFVLDKKNTKVHVDYYVCNYRGDEVSYIAEKGYTNYLQGAKRFDKVTAREKAAILTRRSRTGIHWTIQSVACK